MKKQLSLLCLGLLTLGALAQAKTVNMTVDIPFNFVVNGVTLPSGEYTIQGLGADGSAISIRSADQKAKSLTLSIRCETANTPESSKLVFHRYGDRYFLAQLWMEGDNSGHELPTSKRETEMALDYPSHQVVLVAALR
jgi:hypothetical protein